MRIYKTWKKEETKKWIWVQYYCISSSSKRSVSNNASGNREGLIYQTFYFFKNKKRRTSSEMLFEKFQSCMTSFMKTQNEAKKQFLDSIIRKLKESRNKDLDLSKDLEIKNMIFSLKLMCNQLNSH